ncbi:venom acid phosphatase Acph-1-like [Atheta coriaria]|uniref:venom acid phosphatase Acph-1-like n=1 Tax=Dalotia coriaria TaxID=877792 RepID=UPI0031F3B427
MMFYQVLIGVSCISFCVISVDALPGYLEAILKHKLKDLIINKVNQHVDKSFKDTLVLTSVVFRHGDRIPELQTGYPNNPYVNDTFFPYDYGDLTLAGQRTLYNKGLELRKRYNDFLGEIYFNDLVESVSSSYRRCQMSLQALHTGLFGGLEDVPIKNISWHAVPYFIIPPEQDNTLSIQLTCPFMMDNIKYPDLNKIDAETKTFFQTLKQCSGFEQVGYRQALLVYDYLKTSSEQGLQIPDDFKSIYPEPLRKYAMQDWNMFTSQTVGLIGPLVKLITDNAVAKASNTLEPPGRKMFLYAGHDLNVYYLLQALNVWEGEEMLYGAYIIIEVHNIRGTYGFKVLLQNGYNEPRLLNITGCGTFCPLSKFVQLSDNLMKLNQQMICT